MTEKVEWVAETEAITIAESASESNAVFVGNRRLFELQTGSAALDGSLGIQTAVSADGPWKWAREPHSDNGRTANTIRRIETPLGNSSYMLPPEIGPAAWIRFKSFTGSATAATPTAQTQSAARSLLLVLKS